MLKHIRNYVELENPSGGIIGTAGQPTREQFVDIARADYRAVINLAMPDHADSIDDEGAIVSALGMNYIHIPVPFDAPTPNQLLRFFHHMNAYASEKVLVHCIMNYRVSAFMFHYQHKSLGMTEAQSRSPMFEQWQPDAVWLNLLQWSAEDIGYTDIQKVKC